MGVPVSKTDVERKMLIECHLSQFYFMYCRLRFFFVLLLFPGFDGLKGPFDFPYFEETLFPG